jgi:U3 small nucleolar RNA-associated protein 10
VNYALQQIKTPTGSCASDILPLLLQISAVASAHFDEKHVAEIYGAARACLNSVLGVIPAVEFVSCVMNLLVGVEDKRVSLRQKLPSCDPLTITQIRSGALNLLSERVPKLSDEVRNSSSPPVLKILNTTKSCLIGDDEEYVQSGLKTFGALACTMVPGEENTFTELIPTVLPLIHNNSCNESAMDALSAIWYVLSMEMI